MTPPVHDSNRDDYSGLDNYDRQVHEWPADLVVVHPRAQRVSVPVAVMRAGTELIAQLRRRIVELADELRSRPAAPFRGPVVLRFHHLWGQAKVSPDYNKAAWLEFQEQVERLEAELHDRRKLARGLKG